MSNKTSSSYTYFLNDINKEHKSNSSMSSMRVKSLPNSKNKRSNNIIFRSLPNQKITTLYTPYIQGTPVNNDLYRTFPDTRLVSPPYTYIQETSGNTTPIVYLSPRIRFPVGPGYIKPPVVSYGPNPVSGRDFSPTYKPSNGPNSEETSPYKKVGKKEVLGKDRVIYKMEGSNKEYVKSKGMYIPVSEYKKLKKNIK